MWAYESVFYQIYPLGFCGAATKGTLNFGIPTTPFTRFLPFQSAYPPRSF